MWKAATGLAILVIGLLLVGLIWVTSNVLSFLQPVLLPVAVAGVIAYLLDPIVARLQSKGMSRLKSVLSVFGSFLLLLTVLGFIIIPPIVTQVSDKKQREQVGSRVISTVERLGETAWLKPVVSWAVSTHQEPALKTIAIPAAETAPAPETNAVKPKFSETNLANYISENTGKIAAFAGRLITSGTSTFIGTFGPKNNLIFKKDQKYFFQIFFCYF